MIHFVKQGSSDHPMEEVRAIEEMKTGRTLHFTDRSVIFLAEELSAMVLSGDGGVRKECRERGLEVHGSIWVIEQVWVRQLALPLSCIQRLVDLKRINSRLPKERIDALIRRIRHGG